MVRFLFISVRLRVTNALPLTAPEILLMIRSRALLFFATSRPLFAAPEKLDAFYDQTRKVLLLFGRQAEQKKLDETKINEGVKSVFEEVLTVLEARKAQTESKAWHTLCEVVLHIAKRVSLFPVRI